MLAGPVCENKECSNLNLPKFVVDSEAWKTAELGQNVTKPQFGNVKQRCEVDYEILRNTKGLK